MPNILFEKYDSGGSTAKFRLIQALFDLLGIIISFAAFGIVYLFVVTNHYISLIITQI